MRKQWRKIRLYFLRQYPRQKKMRGGFAHRILGDKLFDHRLWKPDRHTFSAGLGIGTVIGLLPTYYIQLILAFFCAFHFRVNVSAAVLGTLITNPITTPPIIVMQYKLGLLLIGPPSPERLSQYSGMMKNIMVHGAPYMVGSAVSAVIAGLVAYLASLWLWTGVVKIDHKAHQILDEKKKQHEQENAA